MALLVGGFFIYKSSVKDTNFGGSKEKYRAWKTQRRSLPPHQDAPVVNSPLNNLNGLSEAEKKLWKEKKAELKKRLLERYRAKR